MLGGFGQLCGEDLLVSCQGGGVCRLGKGLCRRGGQRPEEVEEPRQGTQAKQPSTCLRPAPMPVGFQRGGHQPRSEGAVALESLLQEVVHPVGGAHRRPEFAQRCERGFRPLWRPQHPKPGWLPPVLAAEGTDSFRNPHLGFFLLNLASGGGEGLFCELGDPRRRRCRQPDEDVVQVGAQDHRRICILWREAVLRLQEVHKLAPKPLQRRPESHREEERAEHVALLHPQSGEQWDPPA